MYKHPVRKSIILLFVYSVLIIGIFWLQFRSDSVISKNFNGLRISIDQGMTPEGQTVLKNHMKVAFDGITFFSDDSLPVVFEDAHGNRENLILENFEEAENGFTVKYNNGVSLKFNSAGDDSVKRLSIEAELPKKSSLKMAFKPASGYHFEEKSSSKAVLASKEDSFNLNASEITKESVTFSSEKPQVSFATVVKTVHFMLSSITENTSYADNGTFEKNLVQVKNSLVSNTNAALAANATIAENTIIYYAAEMAEKGQFKAAMEAIPNSIKKSNRRSYFSTVFFGNLESLEPSLTREIENMKVKIETALEQKNIDIFGAAGVANYIIITANKSKTQELLRLPSSIEEFEPTLRQASSIIGIYNALKRYGISEANMLSSVLDKCVEKIEKCCSMDGEKIVLSENSTPVKEIEAVEAGLALYNYAKISGRNELVPGSRLIVNSVLTGNTPADLYTLTELYAMDGVGNKGKFFPRVQILKKGTASSDTIWAWSAAEKLSYNFDNATKQAIITIKFPMGDSHYLIIKGIEDFKSIDIYGIQFRTDPRFESYNSSGYRYNENRKVLYLKSRQKEAVETVRLYYGTRQTAVKEEPKVEKPAAPAPQATPSPVTSVENTGSATETKIQETTAE